MQKKLIYCNTLYFTFFVIIFIALSLTLNLKAYAQNSVFQSGSIIYKDGTITPVTRFGEDTRITGIYNNKKITINITRIKRAESLDNKIWRLTNVQGEQFNVTVKYIYTKKYDERAGYQFKYYYFDKITLEEKSVLHSQRDLITKVAAISMEIDIGKMIFNPRTEQYYPPDYMFDPYTAEKLIWKDL